MNEKQRGVIERVKCGGLRWFKELFRMKESDFVKRTLGQDCGRECWEKATNEMDR